MGVVTALKQFPDIKIAYAPKYGAYKINATKYTYSTKAVAQAVVKDLTGISIQLKNIIESEYYPTTVSDIKEALQGLHKFPMLTMDIETKGTKLSTCGIYSIAFAWNMHNGLAFPVDAHIHSAEIKEVLFDFLDSYKGRLIVHKGNFDITIILYYLWMKESFNNRSAQVAGIENLCDKLEDTLLITYLATNSCSGNILGLKDLAKEFAGDWAIDVKDVTKHSLDTVLKYNLIDVLSTWFVYEKYYPKMVQENQLHVYRHHFMRYLKDCIRMQLNGLPINLKEVAKLENYLSTEKETLLQDIGNSPAVRHAEYLIAINKTNIRNAKLKTKQDTIEDNLETFNFNSGKQLQVLLYEVMQLPQIELTATGQLKTSKEVIKTLINHTSNEAYITILKNIADYFDVEKILSGFIPAFKEADVDAYGITRLSGSFNLGGTVSGRMSSNNP